MCSSDLNAPAGEFTSISGGYHNFCALDTDGYANCWGMRPEVNNPPREVLAALDSYDGNACGLRQDGSLLCWGDDAGVRSSVPSGSFVQVSLGARMACAVDGDGRVSCWGTDAVEPDAL